MIKKTYFALWGSILVSLGFAGFLLGAFLGILQIFLITQSEFRLFIEHLIWYSAMPVVIGAALVLIDVFVLVAHKRTIKFVLNESLINNRITVALTAYNDELSIGDSVRDFLSSEFVARVIVVSNNSSDNTIEIAQKAGVIVHNETKQGYGPCVKRALAESAKYEDTELVVLCEGDMTFRSHDIPKFLAYINHAEVVNGTRIVEQLQDSNTQVTNFIHYGNFAVAKLLEMKMLGDVTLSDVGTTYKMIRRKTLLDILPKLNDNINLEFNAHFIETCVEYGHSLVEIPITFYPRIGISKGASSSVWAALKIGTRMIWGILFGWSRAGHE